jgi:hypothetical protein
MSGENIYAFKVMKLPVKSLKIASEQHGSERVT